jgi:2-polyprenyl-3-methyl-5-hydroxy-6-metoxy-1,4-benzoquinol methylase
MMLLPDRLRELWKDVDAGRMNAEQFAQVQEQELDDYRAEWRNALLENGEMDLRTSLLSEVAHYYGLPDLAEADRRCSSAVDTLRNEWHERVDPQQPASIEKFYQSAATIYDLMGWHSLRDDTIPLAYVLGLKIAQAHGVQRCLDFGSGVGSGAILFTRAGIAMSLADISGTLLNFSRWRSMQRGLSAEFFDLRHTTLPTGSFDMILAMDVFEHLTDPVMTVEQIWRALRPGGLLFARIQVQHADTHPQHIVQDFGRTFNRMRELELVEIWRDTWLWGHQLFEKAGKPG